MEQQMSSKRGKQQGLPRSCCSHANEQDKQASALSAGVQAQGGGD